MKESKSLLEAKKKIPRHYNPWLHLLLPTNLAIGIIILLLVFMNPISWIQLITIPIALVILSSWEWLIHRFWMHQQFKPFSFLFKSHRLHHQLYSNTRMEISDWSELYFVLTPFYALVLVFTTIIPIFLILSFISWNVASLFIITTLVYFIVYEWTHMSYHLSPKMWVKSNRVTKFLSRHHVTHHIPKNMVKYNFNVTFPLFDWIGKTYHE